VANSFEENDCENANTRAQDGEHLVVLAHLRRKWSLSSRGEFGALSPSRRACEAGFGAFMEVKCIFSTMLETENFSKSSWIEMEANGGHW
jgi:hypothetical protein